MRVIRQINEMGSWEFSSKMPNTAGTAIASPAADYSFLRFNQILGNRAVGRMLQARLKDNARRDNSKQEAN